MSETVCLQIVTFGSDWFLSIEQAYSIIALSMFNMWNNMPFSPINVCPLSSAKCKLSTF